MTFDPTTFWNGLLTILQQFTTWITDEADGGAMEIMALIINMLRTIGFITQTDVKLVNTLSDLMGWNEIEPLVDAVLRLALVLGTIAHIGHHYWGWRSLPDSLQRWGVTVLLVRASVQILDMTLQVMSDMTAGIAGALPNFPNLNGTNPFVVIALMLVWVVLLFQLVMACAERIAWLIILKPVGPLALLTWVLPQSAWVADKYIKLWVGWLTGQFFVVLAVAAMEQLASHQGIEGYFLSCACLVVGRKAISLLVPGGGEGLFGLKFGPVKI